MSGQVLAAIIGGTFALISPLLVKLFDIIIAKINKKLKRVNKIDNIGKTLETVIDKLHSIEKDQKKANLLVLFSDYRDHPDIQKLCKEYVEDYNGNSYVLPLILEWYHEKGIYIPEWLRNACERHNVNIGDDVK